MIFLGTGREKTKGKSPVMGGMLGERKPTVKPEREKRFQEAEELSKKGAKGKK